MDSREHKRSASKRRDRISGLSDDVLGHVLSFLPTKEAARAAALSRRWRRVFGSVHTVSFEEAEGERASDWTTWYYEMLERKSCSTQLLDDVGAALLCRRRCAGLRRLPAPLRSLRFAFDSWHWWDTVAIDQWLAYVLPPPSDSDTHPGLHLDLCFRIGPTCTLSDDRRRGDAGSDSDDGEIVDKMWMYLLPRRLFSCTALRTLCVAYCRLALPRISAVELPFLETMRLTALGDSGRSIQWLISSCPRLADLTLEALWNLKRVSVLNKPLRRFAIRCCHNLRSVDIDASKLRSLEYVGRGPSKSFLCLHGSPLATIPLCTIDLCNPLSGEAEFARFTRFLEEISNTKHLHLHHDEIVESRFFDFPLFSSLTRLTLEGFIGSSNTVISVCRILEHTPNLEVLSLVMWDSPVEKADMTALVFGKIPEQVFSLPCLRTRVREISVEDYEGSVPEKMLVKLLLRNALVLERLQVVFTEEFSSARKKLEDELGRWGVANSEKVFTY